MFPWLLRHINLLFLAYSFCSCIIGRFPLSSVGIPSKMSVTKFYESQALTGDPRIKRYLLQYRTNCATFFFMPFFYQISVFSFKHCKFFYYTLLLFLFYQRTNSNTVIYSRVIANVYFINDLFGLSWFQCNKPNLIRVLVILTY